MVKKPKLKRSKQKLMVYNKKKQLARVCQLLLYFLYWLLDNFAKFDRLTVGAFDVEELDSVVPEVKVLYFRFLQLKASRLGSLKRRIGIAGI